MGDRGRGCRDRGVVAVAEVPVPQRDIAAIAVG